MRTLDPSDKRTVEAYLRIALVALNNAANEARGAAVASMASFTEGASDTALVRRLRTLISDTATVRGDLEQYLRQ